MYELQRVGEGVERLSVDEKAVAELEEEVRVVKAHRKMEREMRKEGIDIAVLGPREARVKRPRDFGPVILQ